MSDFAATMKALDKAVEYFEKKYFADLETLTTEIVYNDHNNVSLEIHKKGSSEYTKNREISFGCFDEKGETLFGIEGRYYLHSGLTFDHVEGPFWKIHDMNSQGAAKLNEWLVEFAL